MTRSTAGAVCAALLAASLAAAVVADDKPKAKKATGAAVEAEARADAGPAANAELARQAQSVLRQHCARCHQGPGSISGAAADFLSRADLLRNEYVKPGAPGESFLIQRIVDGEMPPPGENPVPRLEDLATLWHWIEAEAPEFPRDPARRAFVSLQSVMEAAVKHLAEASAQDRPFLRLFTLHNLANRPGVTEEDLNIARAALAKAVNSLSRKNRKIVVPRAIDAAQLVFAVDLRDYAWEPDLWHDVEAAYPYAFRYGAHPDATLRALDEELDRLLPRAFPIFRADWFVATAMRPPLYHTLLQVPENARDLERELGVNIAADFLEPRAGQVAYAGLAKSGVSGQNRHLERHEFERGGFWISRDFKPGNARSSLVRFPLGPLNLFPHGHHPFPDQAFIHDGGEIIYPLPNGLQAYMLVKGDDARIDAGPIDVVSDSLRTSGTPEIVNGISCNTCHKHGMIGFQDAIRDHSAVFDEPEAKLKQLYVAPKTMDEHLAEDTQRFLGALTKAIGPFLLVGAGKEQPRPIEKLPEPISELARAYRVDYLDLAAVAAEQDVEDPNTLREGVGLANLKRLGLEGLLKKGGVVSRADWEAVDNGVSLMQRVGQELRKEPRNRR